MQTRTLTLAYSLNGFNIDKRTLIFPEKTDIHAILEEINTLIAPAQFSFKNDLHSLYMFFHNKGRANIQEISDFKNAIPLVDNATIVINTKNGKSEKIVDAIDTVARGYFTTLEDPETAITSIEKTYDFLLPKE